MISTFLKDIQVLDISTVLAGPSVGMFLAELGASVLKLENPATKGDITRQWKNPNENKQRSISAYYAAVNAFKQIQFADFNDEKTIQNIHKKISNTDILICNFKYGNDKKFQLDYETLKKINPSLIYAHLSGFGKQHTRVAYDLILQAETGFMFLNREPHHLPNKMPVALIDVLAAHHLKEGILLALYQRLKTGKGAYIHCSLYDAAVCSLINQATNYLVSHYNPPPIGSKHPNIAPYGEIFQTQDRQLITLAIGSDKQFKALCQLLNIPHIATHPHFADNAERVKNRSVLYDILQKPISANRAEWLYNSCLQKDIPVAIIRDVAQVMNDPHTQKLIKPVVIEGHTLNVITSVAFEMSE